MADRRRAGLALDSNALEGVTATPSQVSSNACAPASRPTDQDATGPRRPSRPPHRRRARQRRRQAFDGDVQHLSPSEQITERGRGSNS